MARATKMKVKSSGDGKYEVLCLVRHPMETGLRKDSKTGKVIPAHYIQSMEFSLNGAVFATASLGGGVSANPLVGVEVMGAKAGDKISVNWSDNQGESGTADASVK